VANPRSSSKSSIRPLSQDAAPIRLSAGKRREQLIQVAVDLFSRKGFNGTTTREIAAAAGVTEAIIFRHFATKEQLYTAIIDRRLNAPDAAVWIAGLRAAMDRDDDEAVIRHLINAIVAAHKNDPKFERLMLYAALEGNEIASGTCTRSPLPSSIFTANIFCAARKKATSAPACPMSL
jgi:TetR/AcrR family transcriptional regulator